MWIKLAVILFFLCVALPHTHAFYEGLYCGEDNCYELLGVSRESTRSEISKAYRKLARVHHPDRKGGDAAMFRKIATAYEILKDEDARKDYDYMLDNPEEAYYNYYRYYKRRVAPKVDVRIVLAATLSIVSVIQYFQQHYAYSEAVKYAMQNPRLRNQALQIIHSEGLLDGENHKKKKNKKSKDERRKEEEKVLKAVVEDSIDIKGSYVKPSIRQFLIVQLLTSPYYIATYMVWNAMWIWRYTICKQEYDKEAKVYLTYRGLKFTFLYWQALDEDSKRSYMHKELWIPEKLHEYNEEMEEEYRRKMAEDSKQKMWRRYMKAGGPGRMTFEED